MTVSQIYSTVESCITDSNLVLPANAFGSATMEAIFNACLTDQELVINDVNLTSDATSVTVTGAGQNQFATIFVTATFTPTSDDVSVSVTGAVSTSWDPSTVFPGLPTGMNISVSANLCLQTLTGQAEVQGISFIGTVGSLNVSPIDMGINDCKLVASYAPPAGETEAVTIANISGTLVFNDSITFPVSFSTDGSFQIVGNIPSLDLLDAISRLANMPLMLPAGFDLSLTDCVVAISDDGSGNLQFSISASVTGFGNVAFLAQKTDGEWGYAAGLALGSVPLSSVPGLSDLAPFVSYFSFQELTLMVTTIDNFTFSDNSAFDSLPPSPAGMTAFASIVMSGQQELDILGNLIDISGLVVDITLVVGLPTSSTNSSANMINDSSLSASISGKINSCTTLSGTLEAKLVGDVPQLSVTGEIATNIQSQPITFDVIMTFVPNGATISGGFTGTIGFEYFQLSNLILEIGVDLEGVPSIGYGATITVLAYQNSEMILLNSTDPLQSMYVASTSGMTLGTVLTTLSDITDTSLVPADIMAMLNSVGLSGTQAFDIADADNSLAISLNNQDVESVTAAFNAAQTGGTPLPAFNANEPLQVLITVATEGSVWFITDMVNILHYNLNKAGSGAPVAVSLQPQLYVVPQETQIGTITVPAGYGINGSVDLLGFNCSLTVVITPTTGISIDAAFSKMIITYKNSPVFSFTSADGSTGPQLKVNSDPNNAYFYANGAISILGVLNESVDISYTPTSGSFTMSASVDGVAEYTLSGSYGTGSPLFATSGSATVGVNTNFTLPPVGGLSIGNININTNVGFDYSVTVDSTTDGGSGSVSGNFIFEGVPFSIPSFTLDLNTSSLAALATEAVTLAEVQITSYLEDAVSWLTWLGDGIILGIDAAAADTVGAILGAYQMVYDDIATQTTAILSYTSDQVADALAAAGATADETMDILVNTLGETTDEALDAVNQAFTGSHADITIAGHTDEVTIPHGDSTSPGVHDDTSAHADIPGVHDDAKAHYDTPHFDEIGISVPHQDSGSHTDSTSPHGDSTTHTDSTPPPVHFDTPPAHIDIPTIHTDVDNI